MMNEVGSPVGSPAGAGYPSGARGGYVGFNPSSPHLLQSPTRGSPTYDPAGIPPPPQAGGRRIPLIRSAQERSRSREMATRQASTADSEGMNEVYTPSYPPHHNHHQQYPRQPPATPATTASADLRKINVSPSSQGRGPRGFGSHHQREAPTPRTGNTATPASRQYSQQRFGRFCSMCGAPQPCWCPGSSMHGGFVQPANTPVNPASVADEMRTPLTSAMVNGEFYDSDEADEAYYRNVAGGGSRVGVTNRSRSPNNNNGNFHPDSRSPYAQTQQQAYDQHPEMGMGGRMQQEMIGGANPRSRSAGSGKRAGMMTSQDSTNTINMPSVSQVGIQEYAESRSHSHSMPMNPPMGPGDIENQMLSVDDTQADVSLSCLIRQNAIQIKDDRPMELVPTSSLKWENPNGLLNEWNVKPGTRRYEVIDTNKLTMMKRQRTQVRRGTTFIAITMFNEEWELLHGTLEGVIYNHFEWAEKRHGERGFPLPQVIVVADGRDKLSACTRKALTDLGIIDERMDDRPGEDIVHIFSCKLTYRQAERDYGPLTVKFVFKEINKGKLHSHRIFFGFCAMYCPEYVMLLDAGTKPNRTGLWLLFESMERDERLGGCSGEIEAETKWTNPIVMSQYFEYKIAHILDKATESVMGFISVLPGAFSAYRYNALTIADHEKGVTPLHKYFDGLAAGHGPFLSNMHLAEDRILCFELVARRGTSYTLKYILDSRAVTDVQTNTVDLLKQRKRWLNGALFALVYVFTHVRQFLSSGLNPCRKLAIISELAILTFLTTINMAGPALYFLLFKFVVFDTLQSRPEEVGLQEDAGKIASNCLLYSFLAIFFMQVVLGIGNNRPNTVAHVYTAIVLYYCAFQAVLVGMAVRFLIEDGPKTTMIAASALILYPVGCLVHHATDIFKMCVAMPMYLMLSPVYIIMLPVRAFANIDDISWGTKGLEAGTAASTAKDQFQRFRTVFLISWVLLNLGVAIAIWQISEHVLSFSSYFLRIMFYIAAGINLFRFFALCWLRASTWCVRHTLSLKSHDSYIHEDEDAPLHRAHTNESAEGSPSGMSAFTSVSDAGSSNRALMNSGEFSFASSGLSPAHGHHGGRQPPSAHSGLQLLGGNASGSGHLDESIAMLARVNGPKSVGLPSEVGVPRPVGVGYSAVSPSKSRVEGVSISIRDFVEGNEQCLKYAISPTVRSTGSHMEFDTMSAVSDMPRSPAGRGAMNGNARSASPTDLLQIPTPTHGAHLQQSVSMSPRGQSNAAQRGYSPSSVPSPAATPTAAVAPAGSWVAGNNKGNGSANVGADQMDGFMDLQSMMAPPPPIYVSGSASSIPPGQMPNTGGSLHQGAIGGSEPSASAS